MAEQKSDNLADTICVKAVPKGKLDPNEHFELVKGTKLDELKDNQLLVEVEYISPDPYLKGEMATYFQTPSKAMAGFVVAKVLESKDDKYEPGDYIGCLSTWSTKSIVDSRMVAPIPPNLKDYEPKKDPDYKQELESDEDSKFNIDDLKKIPRSYYIGSYGLPGMTAYYGLLYRAQIKKGENVLISGAAGAVGSICGQIAKSVFGCHTIGIAGSAEKLKWLTDDLGFDGALNYKKYGDDIQKAQDALKQQFPKGIDLYFDNVGGVFTEAVWDILNPKARVIVCGQISKYQNEKPIPVQPFLGKIIKKEIEIRGIMVFNFRNYTKFYYDMGKWLSSGKIKVKETVVDGFEKAPEAFAGLFSGKNIGKMVVKCC